MTQPNTDAYGFTENILPPKDVLKNDTKRQAGRTLSVIEEQAPELISHLRVGDPRLIEKVLKVRINDIKDQMSTNRDPQVHMELIGRVAQLKEVIATFHYVRM